MMLGNNRMVSLVWETMIVALMIGILFPSNLHAAYMRYGGHSTLALPPVSNDSVYIQNRETDTSAVSNLYLYDKSGVYIIYTISTIDGSSIDFVIRKKKNGVKIFDCFAIYNAAADGKQFLFYNYANREAYIMYACVSGFYPIMDAVDFDKKSVLLINENCDDAKADTIEIGDDQRYVPYNKRNKFAKARLAILCKCLCDEDTITNTFKRATPAEHPGAGLNKSCLSVTTMDISKFDLAYYQQKIQENGGELSLPSSCYYTEWDGTQKQVTITEEGYSLSMIKARSFFRELKLYHKNTIIRAEGAKLFMSNVNVGIWREYNEQGILINEVDEDRKFDSLLVKPLDVLKYIEHEGCISLQTGEGQERFDKQNEINIHFVEKQESKNVWSKREPAKWVIEFYDIEKGNVMTHVIDAESSEVISKTKEFLEE